MTDSLKERLDGVRCCMIENDYEDYTLAQEALARIEELEARLVSNSEAGLRERTELRATIAKLERHNKILHQAIKKDAATIAKLEAGNERNARGMLSDETR